MKVKFVIILVLAILAGACKQQVEPPVFKGINNIKLSQSQKGFVGVKADAQMFNPNNLKVKLRSANIDVMVKGKKVANMKKNFGLIIQPNADFSVPMELDLNLGELGLINTLMGILGGRHLEVQYVGTVKVSSKGVPFSVPINYHDKLKLR